MILTITRGGLPDLQDQPLNIFLLSERDLDQEVNDQERRELEEFVRSLSGEVLNEGLTFEIDEGDTPGVRVQVVDENLEIDLTTETLTHLLLKHLSPRFRAIMED